MNAWNQKGSKSRKETLESKNYQRNKARTQARKIKNANVYKITRYVASMSKQRLTLQKHETGYQGGRNNCVCREESQLQDVVETK